MIETSLTSDVSKYSIEKSQKNVITIDFKIIDKNFNNQRPVDQRPTTNVKHTREIY